MNTFAAQTNSYEKSIYADGEHLAYCGGIRTTD